MNYMPYIVIKRDNLRKRAKGKDQGPVGVLGVGEKDTGPKIAEVLQLKEKANQIRAMVSLKEKARERQKVRTREAKVPRADASIVVEPTTHPIAQREKEAKQVSSKINQTHGGNKTSRELTTQCPNH